MVDEGRPLTPGGSPGDCGVFVGSDDDVAVAIAVHVAGSGDGDAEFGVGEDISNRPIRVQAEASGRAVIDKGGAVELFLGLGAGVPGRADDHVTVAIAVHVAGGGGRAPKVGVCLVGRVGAPGGVGGQAGRPAVVDEGGPLVRLFAVVAVGRDDHVGVTVSVHVPGGGDGGAEAGAGAEDGGALPGRRGGPVGSGRQARRPAVVDEYPAVVYLLDVVVRCADDDVAVAIVVHIAGGGDGLAEPGPLLIALSHPGRADGGAVWPAGVEKRGPFIGLTMVVARRSDDDVGVAVAVHIAGGSDGPAEEHSVITARGAPGRGSSQPAGAAVIDERAALVGMFVVVASGSDG